MERGSDAQISKIQEQHQQSELRRENALAPVWRHALLGEHFGEAKGACGVSAWLAAKLCMPSGSEGERGSRRAPARPRTHIVLKGECESSWEVRALSHIKCPLLFILSSSTRLRSANIIIARAA